MNIEPLLRAARKEFHKQVIGSVLTLNDKGIPTNADSSQRTSVAIAREIASMLEAETGERLKGQTSGHKFEQLVADYVKNAFGHLAHLRPGKWDIFQVANRNRLKIAEYTQYEHLITLETATNQNPT